LGTIKSFEALIRWRRADGSVMNPGQFLPAAKAAGLLGEVSTSMLALVAPIVARWNTRRIAEGNEPVCVHVNCVEEQLCDLGFPDVVGSLLAFNNVDPSWIMLEISEETALDKIPRGMPTLQYLRAMGIKFSLDDFGFGNSSLTMLRELGDIAELKLDKSIVDDIATDGIGADSDVVDAILGFAKRRNMTIVAEGIEQQEQWEALRNLGVHLFQGYLFSRPVPTAQAEELLFAPVPVSARASFESRTLTV
jgi:EAL domain-containing protein (putative c-di-GMP-specific phosphodiesterase class I)